MKMMSTHVDSVMVVTTSLACYAVVEIMKKKIVGLQTTTRHAKESHTFFNGSHIQQNKKKIRL